MFSWWHVWMFLLYILMAFMLFGFTSNFSIIISSNLFLKFCPKSKPFQWHKKQKEGENARQRADMCIKDRPTYWGEKIRKKPIDINRLLIHTQHTQTWAEHAKCRYVCVCARSKGDKFIVFTECVAVSTRLRKSSISTIVFPSTTTILHYSTMHLMLSRVIGAKFILYWITINCLFVDFSLYIHFIVNEITGYFSIKFWMNSISFPERSRWEFFNFFFLLLSYGTTIHVHRQKFNVPLYQLAMTLCASNMFCAAKKTTTKSTVPGTGIN